MSCKVSYEAVVVGGGVVGLSTAWALARKGFRRVLVLERGPAAAGATVRSAGVVTSQLWTPEDISLALLTQNILSILESIGRPVFQFDRCGSLTVVGPGQETHLYRQAELIAGQGGAVELWTPDRVRQAFPAISTQDITMGLFTPQDGVLRPAELLATLGAAVRAAGVDVLDSAVVERLVLRGDRVQGVQAGGQVLSAGRVILCAGIGTQTIARSVGLDPPLVPVRTQVSVALLPGPVALPETTDALRGVYCFFRRPCSLFFGYGTEWEGVDPDRYRQERDHEEEQAALQRLAARIPVLHRSRVVGGWAGVCDITTDVLPLIGPHRHLPGLYLNCGFGGYGISRGPGAGEVLAALVAGEDPGLDLSPYRADRHPARAQTPVDFFGEPWPVSTKSNRVGA